MSRNKIPIIQDPHETLRGIAKPVSQDEFATTNLADLCANMQTALATQKDGVALAAPQIDVPKRIFVVAPEAFQSYQNQPLVYINPVITKRSKETAWLEEGCLSVRWLYGKVERALSVSLEAYDVSGKKFTAKATGLLAQIFQHEVDHLDGVLFHDSARALRELSDAEIAEYQQSLNEQ